MVGLWVATAIGNPESKGFHVRLLRPLAQKQPFDPWLQPIVIRVAAEAQYYFRRQRHSCAQIPKALTAFFETRANRTVYIEGDLDSNFGDVVEAADAVRHAGGQVVLLTPTRP